MKKLIAIMILSLFPVSYSYSDLSLIDLGLPRSIQNEVLDIQPTTTVVQPESSAFDPSTLGQNYLSESIAQAGPNDAACILNSSCDLFTGFEGVSYTNSSYPSDYSNVEYLGDLGDGANLSEVAYTDYAVQLLNEAETAQDVIKILNAVVNIEDSYNYDNTITVHHQITNTFNDTFSSITPDNMWALQAVNSIRQFVIANRPEDALGEIVTSNSNSQIVNRAINHISTVESQEQWNNEFTGLSSYEIDFNLQSTIQETEIIQETVTTTVEESVSTIDVYKREVEAYNKINEILLILETPVQENGTTPDTEAPDNEIFNGQNVDALIDTQSELPAPVEVKDNIQALKQLEGADLFVKQVIRKVKLDIEINKLKQEIDQYDK